MTSFFTRCTYCGHLPCDCTERPSNVPRHCVEILKPDHTTTTYARATVDEFTRGTLTVTSVDDGSELKTYRPGEWREARAYGGDGWPTHAFEAKNDDIEVQDCHDCGHRLYLHHRHASGAYRCKSFGCGCECFEVAR